MDPLTFTATMFNLSWKAFELSKELNDIRPKYKDAGPTIKPLCIEFEVIHASLNRVRRLVQKDPLPKPNRDMGHELCEVFDTAVTGCNVVLSCLEEEIKTLKSAALQSGSFGWKVKARYIWKEEIMRDLLFKLRAQRGSISLLFQSVQMNSMTELNRLLRARSPEIKSFRMSTIQLRKSYPTLNVPESVFGVEKSPHNRSFSENAVPSSISPTEFCFDDDVVNSAAYRKAATELALHLPSPISETTNYHERSVGISGDDWVDMKVVSEVPPAHSASDDGVPASPLFVKPTESEMNNVSSTTETISTDEEQEDDELGFFDAQEWHRDSWSAQLGNGQTLDADAPQTVPRRDSTVSDPLIAALDGAYGDFEGLDAIVTALEKSTEESSGEDSDPDSDSEDLDWDSLIFRRPHMAAIPSPLSQSMDSDEHTGLNGISTISVPSPQFAEQPQRFSFSTTPPQIRVRMSSIRSRKDKDKRTELKRRSRTSTLRTCDLPLRHHNHHRNVSMSPMPRRNSAQYSPAFLPSSHPPTPIPTIITVTSHEDATSDTTGSSTPRNRNAVIFSAASPSSPSTTSDSSAPSTPRDMPLKYRARPPHPGLPPPAPSMSVQQATLLLMEMDVNAREARMMERDQTRVEAGRV